MTTFSEYIQAVFSEFIKCVEWVIFIQFDSKFDYEACLLYLYKKRPNKLKEKEI